MTRFINVAVHNFFMDETRTQRAYHYTIKWKYDTKIKTQGLVPQSSWLLEFFPRAGEPDFLWERRSKEGRELGKKMGVDKHRSGTQEYKEAVKRFLGFPLESYFNVTYGFLEPRPAFMENHPRFPDLWARLFHPIIGIDPMDMMDHAYADDTRRIALLSFDLSPTDQPFISDHGHVVDMGPDVLWNKSLDVNQRVALVRENMRKYFESLVPLSQYTGGYSLPVLMIKGSIAPERIKIEWTKSPYQVKVEFGAKGLYTGHDYHHYPLVKVP